MNGLLDLIPSCLEEEEIVAANEAVLDYIEGLSQAEYLFAEYGIRVEGFEE